MQQPDAKPGIYLNAEQMKALRAPTAWAVPSAPGWQLLSEDTMIGMVDVRRLAAERGLVSDPSGLEWTGRADPEPAAQ